MTPTSPPGAMLGGAFSFSGGYYGKGRKEIGAPRRTCGVDSDSPHFLPDFAEALGETGRQEALKAIR